MRNLDQDSGAIPGLRIAPARAAMREIDQDLDALQDDVVRFPSLNIGDKADTAAIVLMLRTIQPLRLRQAQNMDNFRSFGYPS